LALRLARQQTIEQVITFPNQTEATNSRFWVDVQTVTAGPRAKTPESHIVLCQPGSFALKRWAQRHLRTPDARFMSSLRNFLILSAVAVALAGCGVRGPLEPPPGAAAPDPV
jgi:hypothetical protein